MRRQKTAGAATHGREEAVPTLNFLCLSSTSTFTNLTFGNPVFDGSLVSVVMFRDLGKNVKDVFTEGYFFVPKVTL